MKSEQKPQYEEGPPDFWHSWHFFPFPSSQDKKYGWQSPTPARFIITPIQSSCFPTKKLKFQSSNFSVSANTALHFVNPFIMRQPILIQFKMEKTNRALSPQRKSKKSHSGFNIQCNSNGSQIIIYPFFYGFPGTVLCFNQIIHCHSFWKEKSQYRISAPNLFTASYQLKKF